MILLSYQVHASSVPCIVNPTGYMIVPIIPTYYSGEPCVIIPEAALSIPVCTGIPILFPDDVMLIFDVMHDIQADSGFRFPY